MRPLVRWLVPLAAAAIALGAPPRVVNTFPLVFPDGGGQIEWLTPSSFRFLRNWADPERIKEPLTPKMVAVAADESATVYSFKSRYLTVEVQKSGGGILVKAGSKEVLVDGRVRRDNGRGILEQRAGASERFYGLGARDAARFDLRGMAIETRNAFLLSSAGFAQYYRAPGAYRFDLAASRPESVAVTAPEERIEFFFYYGPVPKDIFEEHLAVTGPVDPFGAADFKVRQAHGRTTGGSWGTLSASIRTLLHASLSADLIPEFDLSPYAKADADLLASAAEVASVMPVLRAPAGGAPFAELLRWRERLAPYLLSYTKEAQDRGVPVLRPLEVDSDEDPAARNRSGEFKVGDELLAAPVLRPGVSPTVYLPRGLWTDLGSGQTYKGRQEIRVSPRAGQLALFAKNGTIVPLGPETGDVLELHYFPDLGAEFFLFEEADQDISQFHAAPAGDLMRFEIESRVNRVYDWVMHDAGPCRRVDGGGVDYAPVPDPAQLAPGRWYADPSKRLLRIRVRAVAGGDEVVHVTF
jgi:alpha-glucosidase (family GH31 glycosyl hydrolase)